MTQRSTHHATFVIEQTYGASPERVFNAWADPAAKGRWFVGPDEWKKSDHVLDFRVGGRERLSGGPPGGPVHSFDGTYRDIVPNRRIIYEYDMHLDEKRISVSLATVELEPAGTGTRLIFTEQGAFLDGYDNAADREHGTRELLANLEKELRSETAEESSEREIVSSRVLDFPRELVFNAWSDPDRLAQWWGPKGFTNTFQEFDLKPGGTWRFVMHGPDGTDYKNHSVFVEIVKPDRIVLDHLSGPKFRLTATLAEQGARTRLTWRMRFETAAERDRAKVYVVDANEQNFDRLEAQLAKMAASTREPERSGRLVRG
jgi:uncharacterized protein YndB with AHSA1/START domain